MPPARPVRTAGSLLVAALAALLLSACGDAGTTTSPPPTTSRVAATSSSSSSQTSTTDTTTTSTTTIGTETETETVSLPGADKPVITVGDKNYTEQFVLGQLYVQALQAQGYTVNVTQNIGPADVTLQALKSGSLSMYPEYLGTFNTAVAGYRHGFRTESDAYDAAQHYASAHGLDLLDPTPFSDTDAIAVTDAYAAANHLRSIGDLRRVGTTLTFGGPPGFQQGTPGLPLIASSYGVTPAVFKQLAIGDQYAELNTNVVQAADVMTTDGPLASGDYVLLRDPRRIFGWGNVIPVISDQALANEGPAFTDTIQRVDEALTTDVIRRLNQAVDISQQSPATVAKQFLETHGLLTPMPS
jgi:osmoprotectant transport system substrate-binding protein